MRGTVARRGICAGCAAHAARIGDASTGRRIATGEKAAAAATADSSKMVRIVYPRLASSTGGSGFRRWEKFRGSWDKLIFVLLCLVLCYSKPIAASFSLAACSSARRRSFSVADAASRASYCSRSEPSASLAVTSVDWV